MFWNIYIYKYIFFIEITSESREGISNFLFVLFLYHFFLSIFVLFFILFMRFDNLVDVYAAFILCIRMWRHELCVTSSEEQAPRKLDFLSAWKGFKYMHVYDNSSGQKSFVVCECKFFFFLCVFRVQQKVRVTCDLVLLWLLYDEIYFYWFPLSVFSLKFRSWSITIF